MSKLDIKSVRLTDGLRSVIAGELVKGKFVAELDALYPRAAELAVLTYQHLYGMDTEKKMAALPSGWLPEWDKIIVQFGEHSTKPFHLHFNGYSKFLPRKDNREFKEKGGPPTVARRFLQKDFQKYPALVLNKTGALAKAVFALEVEGQQLEEKKSKLRREVDGILASVSTTGKLVEVWPEVGPIVRKLAPVETPIANLPARVLTDLNARLGLEAA